MKDNFQREINYLRISVTDYCNFRCKYCMPEEGVLPKARHEILTLEEMYHIVYLLVELGIRKVRITGGEPLLRKGLPGLIYSLHLLEKIEDLAMTTNGSLLKKQAKTLKEAGLMRVNVSLDSLKPEVFQRLSRGDLKDVLGGIHEALDQGMGVKINTVLLKGINDEEIGDFVRLTEELPVDVRFIELMPFGPTLDFSRRHFLSCDEVLQKIPLVEEEKQEFSSAARLYRSEKGRGRVGLIKPISCSFCSECNRLRLSADGKIKPCLHSDDKVDLLEKLRKSEDLRPLLRQAIDEKPPSHHLVEGLGTTDSMHRIGG